MGQRNNSRVRSSAVTSESEVRADYGGPCKARPRGGTKGESRLEAGYCRDGSTDFPQKARWTYQSKS